ncbi:uncharacterized protein DFL_007579 [Arthrobotrys flagrans]|uniref:Uncharacterized protein n=1 Tax=Arthrobotrys flagrans TaxID=97331 RepID=A0A436ZW70_ARTFL|nr:hypothetical protein DFL_007579 [Arthrobotrys flagrans]
MHFSVLSLALLAASAIPSAVAQTTIYKTVTTTKTLTVKSTSWTWSRTTTIIYNPTTVTKHETYTKIAVRTRIVKPSPVTITKTVTKCPPSTKDDDGDKEEEGGEEEEEDNFKTCPPAAVVTATPSCKGGTPCPTKSLCQQDQPTVTYRCNCGGAPKRTVTATPRCAEDCCGGYVPTLYTFVPLPFEKCAQPGGVSEVTI